LAVFLEGGVPRETRGKRAGPPVRPEYDRAPAEVDFFTSLGDPGGRYVAAAIEPVPDTAEDGTGETTLQ